MRERERKERFRERERIAFVGSSETFRATSQDHTLLLPVRF